MAHLHIVLSVLFLNLLVPSISSCRLLLTQTNAGDEKRHQPDEKAHRPFHNPALGRTSRATSIDVLHLPASRSDGAGAALETSTVRASLSASLISCRSCPASLTPETRCPLMNNVGVASM